VASHHSSRTATNWREHSDCANRVALQGVEVARSIKARLCGCGRASNRRHGFRVFMQPFETRDIWQSLRNGGRKRIPKHIVDRGANGWALPHRCSPLPDTTQDQCHVLRGYACHLSSRISTALIDRLVTYCRISFSALSSGSNNIMFECAAAEDAPPLDAGVGTGSAPDEYCTLSATSGLCCKDKLH